MSNRWFRLYSEILHDHKVQQMTEPQRWRLVALMCVRCNVAETLQDETIAFYLRISLKEWHATKAVFISNKFIDLDNKLLNWDKRQFLSDSSTDRSRKHRKKTKMQRCGDVSETAPDTDTDTDTDTIVFTDVNTCEDHEKNGGEKTEQQNQKTEVDKSKHKNTEPPCPHSEIIRLYHQALPACRKVVVWSEQRQKFLKARWGEDAERQNLNWWRNFFDYIAKCDFLVGKVNDFVVDLEWIVRPSNFIKILEKKFENRSARHETNQRNNANKSQTHKFWDNQERILAELAENGEL